MKVYMLAALLIMLPLLPAGYVLFLDFQVGPNSFAQFDDLYGYSANPYGATLPFRLVFSALSDFIPNDVIEKVLLFGILFLCGYSMHKALPEKYGDSRYFGGLLYMLNPFVFIRFLAGHWTLLLSYAVWPLAILQFSKFLKKPDRDGMMKVAMLTLIASVSIHGLILLLICYLALFIFHFNRKILRPLAMLSILVIILNLFWIVPSILFFDFLPHNAESYIEDFGATDSLSVASLQGFWFKGIVLTSDMFEFWYLPFLAVFLLSAYGFYLLHEEKPRFALAIVAVFFTAFLLAVADPLVSLLGPLSDLLYFAFRDSHKFAGLLALCYSYLGTVAVQSFDRKYLFALLAIPIIFNFGFFGFLGQIGTTQYPQDWNDAERIMSHDPAEGSILVLPPHLYRDFGWINSTQKNTGGQIFDFFSRDTVLALNIETRNIESDRLDPVSDYVGYLFENRQYINDTAGYLLPTGARYIMLFKDDPDSPHYLYLFRRAWGVENIDLVYESGSFYLFRNSLVKGKLMGSEGGSVTYYEKNPASFRVEKSEDPEVVFARHREMFFNGKETRSLGIARIFTFEKGILENPYFPFILMLFMLAWMIPVLFFFDRAASLIFVLLFFLILYGFIMPNEMGWLIILSAIFVFIKKKPRFINVKSA